MKWGTWKGHALNTKRRLQNILPHCRFKVSKFPSNICILLKPETPKLHIKHKAIKLLHPFTCQNLPARSTVTVSSSEEKMKIHQQLWILHCMQEAEEQCQKFFSCYLIWLSWKPSQFYNSLSTLPVTILPIFLRKDNSQKGPSIPRRTVQKNPLHVLPCLNG